MKRMLLNWSAIFVVFFLLTIPYPYYLLPGFGGFSSPIFESFTRFVGLDLLGLPKHYTYEIVSDSTGMYLQVAFLVFISLVISPFLLKLKANSVKSLLSVLVAYFLALSMFNYGFNKVFLRQFYFPEANLLFTYLGEMSKDILYWSSIGTSPLYSMFMGIIEVIVGLLLLFRRTRLFGSLIGLGVMLNVVAVNFGFDISVKLYSLFLLFLCVLLIAFQRKDLIGFFFRSGMFSGEQKPLIIDTEKKRIGYALLKSFIIVLFLMESTLAYIPNKDAKKQEVAINTIAGAYRLDSGLKWTHVFVHNSGYIIWKNKNQLMKDCKFTYEPVTKTLLFYLNGREVKGRYSKSKNSEILQFSSSLTNIPDETKAVKMDLKGLPISKGGFHWTIDGSLGK